MEKRAESLQKPLMLFSQGSKKRGRALVVIGIVVLVIVILVVGTVFYFYNYHVFKEVRICVGDRVDSEVPCGSDQDCFNLIPDFDASLESAPDFVLGVFDDIFGEVAYCDGTCFIKNVRGVNYETQELEGLESCEEGESEFVMEIRGKEGLEVLKWMKGRA